MQVEVDVKCTETNFGGCDFFGIGVMAPYCLPSKTAEISLRAMAIVHGGQKIESAQKIHASRG